MRAEAEQIGRKYGEYRDGAEFFFSMLQMKAGGVSVWDNMSRQERIQALAKVQDGFEKLPKLPQQTQPDLVAAQRAGFEDGAKRGYESARFESRGVWVAAELTKLAILSASPSGPQLIAISSFSRGLADCAPQTASVAIRRFHGIEIAPAQLQSAFGLPRVSISGFDDAVAYSRNWFELVGIKLAPQFGGFAPVAQGGRVGTYVIFMKGGATGGHVVFGEVSSAGVTVFDAQLGTMFGSIQAAEGALGMKATSAWHIDSVDVPL